MCPLHAVDEPLQGDVGAAPEVGRGGSREADRGEQFASVRPADGHGERRIPVRARRDCGRATRMPKFNGRANRGLIIYTPTDRNPGQESWRPVPLRINGAPADSNPALTIGGSVTLMGYGLHGMSPAVSQFSSQSTPTNYPIVTLKQPAGRRGEPPRVHYARTYGYGEMRLASGDVRQTAVFTQPAELPATDAVVEQGCQNGAIADTLQCVGGGCLEELPCLGVAQRRRRTFVKDIRQQADVEASS
jgi:hypothetical protein